MESIDTPKPPTPRGRAAPPLPERRTTQRERIFDAAAAVFATEGYAAATAEGIAKAAGMSKATFYEHFANKEECLFALFDHAAWLVIGGLTAAGESTDAATYPEHLAEIIGGFLGVLDTNRDKAIVLLSEVQAAGAEGFERRDEFIGALAGAMFYNNAEHAPRFGLPAFSSRTDALVSMYGAVGVAVLQLRTGQPESLLDLEPVLTRLMLGLLGT